MLPALSLHLAVVHNPGVHRAGGERGATAVAYAVMVAIIALLLVGAFVVFSGSIETALNDGADCVSNPGDCGIGGGNGNGGGSGNGGGASTTTTRPAPTTTTTGP